MTSRWTNRNTAGGAPIRLVPTWASLASIEDGVCLVEDSGWVVARDHRLIANQWVPYEACAPGTSWILATNIHKSTFNPASLPAGWVKTGAGGTLTVPSYIQFTATADTYLTYTFGAAGTVDKMLMVSSAAFSSSAAANGKISFGRVNINNFYYKYLMRYESASPYRGYSEEVGPEALDHANVHIQYWKRAAAAAYAYNYGSFTAIPTEHNTLIDQSANNPGQWQANAANDSWRIDMDFSVNNLYCYFDDVVLYYAAP